jgi:magnesium transporter
VQITVYGGKGAREAHASELPGLLAGEETVWVDMTGPTAADVAVMQETFGFHHLAIEDTQNQRQRPKVEEYGDHLFVILNPASHEAWAPGFRELDVFLGRNYVVTVHREAEPVLEAARRRAGGGRSAGAADLLYFLLDTTVDSYFPCLDGIGEQIETLEDELLEEPAPGGLRRLFAVKRTLVEVRKVVGPQRDMFNTLTRHDLPFITARDDLRYYLRDVYDHLLRVSDMLDTYRDLLTGGIDLYMTGVSNRLNRVVNRLTVFTVVIGALAVITGFYGMNFERTWPPFPAPWGVPFTLGFMAAAVVSLVLAFRAARWL